MSSLQKGFHANTKALPDVQYVGGPYYSTGGDNPTLALFPFTFQSGTLEIVYRNGFDATIAIAPLSAKGQSKLGLARRLGGIHLVQSIGPKFRKYIETVEWGSTAPLFRAKHVAVYKPGIVTKVQQLSDQNLPSDAIAQPYSYVVSANPPTTDFLLDTAGYGITFAFEKPLVVSVDAYIADVFSGKRYITFYTSWDAVGAQ